jgi:preprotein translocase subunit SecE
MAEDDDKELEKSRSEDTDLEVREPQTIEERDEESAASEGVSPTQLGTTKYVHAAFFSAGILLTFLLGKILSGVWNLLAEWPSAVRAVPQLLEYAEDERPSFTMVFGGLVALIAIVQVYRRDATRRWADEVATELAKVAWPGRETVQNGTIVVLIACAVATLYIGLLDRFWGFLTQLVYGA